MIREAKATRDYDRKRHRYDGWLHGVSLCAVMLGVFFLLVLFLIIVKVSLPGLTQSYFVLSVDFSEEWIERGDIASGRYRKVLKSGFSELLEGRGSEVRVRDFGKVLSSRSSHILREMVVSDPALVGRRVEVRLPLSDIWDQVNKGLLSWESLKVHRGVGESLQLLFLELKDDGLVEEHWNVGVLFRGDSRFPEVAGLYGAIVGSFYAMLVCFLVSFPLAIATVLYTEELVPRGRFRDIIDVNINNLASVPSVVFGLLGLAFFIGSLGFPRSSPFVGGLVLGLMSLPTMVIAAREAVRRVPVSLREAALSVGATRQQSVFHHVLPSAMPGILTGTIIALARALGEAAPLLLIGMNAFVSSDPGGVMDPATALPTQILIWSDSPERGFVARAGIAIVVLIGFLLLMNGLSIYVRSRWSSYDRYG
jgi:phosphate transport system permease protein